MLVAAQLPQQRSEFQQQLGMQPRQWLPRREQWVRISEIRPLTCNGQRAVSRVTQRQRLGTGYALALDHFEGFADQRMKRVRNPRVA
jgi:hypothetical protein